MSQRLAWMIGVLLTWTVGWSTPAVAQLRIDDGSHDLIDLKPPADLLSRLQQLQTLSANGMTLPTDPNELLNLLTSQRQLQGKSAEQLFQELLNHPQLRDPALLARLQKLVQRQAQSQPADSKQLENLTEALNRLLQALPPVPPDPNLNRPKMLPTPIEPVQPPQPPQPSDPPSITLPKQPDQPNPPVEIGNPTPPPQPPTVAPPQKPPTVEQPGRSPTDSKQPTDPKLKETLEKLMKQLPQQWRESRSGKKLLDTFSELLAQPTTDSERDKWTRELGENLSDIMRNQSQSRWLNDAVRSVESAWPKLNLKLGDAPSTQFPNLGGGSGGTPSGSGFGPAGLSLAPELVVTAWEALFWPIVFVVGVSFVVLLLYRAGWLDRFVSRPQRIAVLLNPQQIRTPQELMRVYEQLALARCGEAARPMHHRAIAEQLATIDPDAAELAGRFYERARYAPEPGLSERDVLAARDPLTRLARPAEIEPPRKDGP